MHLHLLTPQLEDLSHVARTVRQGDWMVVNDLDSGYWVGHLNHTHLHLSVHLLPPSMFRFTLITRGTWACTTRRRTAR